MQIRIRDLAAVAAAGGGRLDSRYAAYMRVWFALGWPAFLSVLGIFYLMVLKPALW